MTLAACRCTHEGPHGYECPHSYPEPPTPTAEDYCTAGGHQYAGDDWTAAPGSDEAVEIGRCYCGTVLYPAGGPPSIPDLLANLERSIVAAKVARAAHRRTP